MKQLRLISNTETEADFNVLFQEPILLKANTTIGLQNLSLFFDDEMIEVNDGNNSFTMEFTDISGQIIKQFGRFTLTNGTYNATSFQTELNFQMNKGLFNPTLYDLVLTTNNFMEVSCVYEKLTKNLSITYALQSADTNPDYLDLQYIQYDGTSNYQKNVVSVFDWAFAYTSKTFCEGQGSTYFRMSDTLGTLTGVALGLIDLGIIIPTSLGTTGLTPAKYNFCVFTDNGAIYKIKNPDGTVEDTGVPANDGDIVEISKGAFSSGIDPLLFDTFGYCITVSQGVLSTTLAQIPYTYNNNLHGAFSINNTTSEIKNYTFTPSPSNVSDKYGSGIHIVKDFRLLEKNNYYSKNVGGTPEPPYNKLFLNLGENTAQLLGFVNPQTNTITGANGAWDADISIYATVIPSSIIVELPNIHIQSYDGDVYYKRRRNILSIVPSVNLEQENTKITFEPNFPIMIDTLNKYEELLTNVHVRVLDLDNVPLKINGNKGVSISLLIQ